MKAFQQKKRAWPFGILAILALVASFVLIKPDKAPAPICVGFACDYYEFFDNLIIYSSAQISVGDPVSPTTGNFAYRQTDLNYPAQGVPLVASRTYSSAFSQQDGPLGFGWKSNLFMHVKYYPDTQEAVVTWGDGHMDLFEKGETDGDITSYIPSEDSAIKPAYSLVKITNGEETYFQVYIKKIDRTIRFGYEDEDDTVFRPTAVFRGHDLSARSAFPQIYTYSDDGEGTKTITVTDQASGRTITVFVDAETGHVTRMTGPDGASVTFTYNEAGELSSVTRADGSAFSFEYDDEHHLTKVNHEGTTILENTYDAQGRVITQKDGLGKITTFSYDDDNKETTVTDPDGKKACYYYDSKARIIKVGPEGGPYKEFAYDEATGQLASIKAPDGSVTSFSYDEEGNLVKKTSPSSKESHYTYDTSGHLTSATTPGGLCAAYENLEDGRLVSYTTPGGHAYSLAYDPSTHLLTSITDPLGASQSFSYGSDGLLITHTRRDAVTISYTREDSTGRAVSKTYNNQDPVSYTYDLRGRLTRVTNDLGTIQMTYTPRGKKASETDVFGKTITYSYDLAARLTGLSIEGLTLTSSYTPAGRLASVSDSFGHTLTFSYDDAGRLTEIAGPKGVKVAYTYASSGRVESIKYYGKDGALLRSMTLSYDEDGLITSLSDSFTPTALSPPAGKSLAFDAADRLTTSSTSDASGRLLSFEDLSFSYNSAGRLSQATKEGLPSATFAYDGLGRRVLIGEGEDVTKLVYAGNLPIMTLDRDGAVKNYLILGHGLGLVLDSSGNLTYMLLSDWRGNIVTVLDGDGNQVASRLYSPYGLVLAQEGSWPVPFGFLGEKGAYTLSSGLVLTLNRAYLPEIGRFITPDPARPNPMEPRALNRYAYSWADPINLFDPSGLSPATSGPRWLIPCVGGVWGCNVRPTMHPTNTLAGVAGPPLAGGFAGLFSGLAEHAWEIGITLTAALEAYPDPSGLVASFFTLAQSAGESEPPPGDPVAFAPGEDYIAGISTVPIVAVI